MKEEIKRKVSRILSHDSNVSEKLSQSTMTHVEHSRLILEVLEEDIPSLFERIEQLEKTLEDWKKFALYLNTITSCSLTKNEIRQAINTFSKKEGEQDA